MDDTLLRCRIYGSFGKILRLGNVEDIIRSCEDLLRVCEKLCLACCSWMKRAERERLAAINQGSDDPSWRSEPSNQPRL